MKYFLLCFFALPQALFSQNYIYKEFGLNDGLPSNQVYDIYEAKNGVMWFATDRGITSYNGYEFTAYGVDDGLLNNCVLDFYPQENGRIYCTTLDNQLFYFNDQFDGFHKYKYSDILSKKLHHFQQITSINIDQNNNFQFNCDQLFQQFSISDNGNLSTIVQIELTELDSAFFIQYKKTHSLKYAYFSTLENKNYTDYNRLKISDSSGIFDLEFLSIPNYTVFRNSMYILLLNDFGEIELKLGNKFRPLCLKSVNDNQLFIGYLHGGGKIIDLKGRTLNTFLKKKSITKFTIDKEGGYWFTTLNSGVFYLKNPKISGLESAITSAISSLSRNKNGELMIGYENGSISKLSQNKVETSLYNLNSSAKGIVEYIPQHESSITFTMRNLNLDMPILDGDSLRYYTKKISEPTDDKIIISTTEGITIFSRQEAGYTSQTINLAIRIHDACYYNNDIFIASTNGLYKIVKNKAEYLGGLSKHLTYRSDDIDVHIARNEVYLATLGGGLVIYNSEKKKISAITEEDGLFSNIVSEIHIEDANTIWACTNSGLNKIHFSEDGSYQITGVRSTDGLPNDGISDIEIINDTVWIGSKKGLVYAPKSLFEPKTNNINYTIEVKQIKVNDSTIELNTNQKLHYNQNRIDFVVETVSKRYENKVKYRYKLVGLEKDYRVSKHREINYSSLPPGKYIFTVQSTTEDGDLLSDALDFPFTITPPFWKTWWFRILVILSIFGIIYLFFKLRILSYNKSISGELMRIALKRLKRKEKYFVFKDGTREKRIKSDTITYVKSDGNYLRVYTEDKNYLIRSKIGEFIALTPDPKEYIRVHRSYIIRIDKVESKGKQEVIVHGEKIPVSITYARELEKLMF